MTDRPRSTRSRPSRAAGALPVRSRARSGSPVGALLATPNRVLLAVALLGSTLFVGWGLVARDSTQIPILCAGLVVYGIVFAALGLLGATTTYRAAREGQAAWAFTVALLGGIAAVISAGCFGLAIVLALVLGAA